MTCSIIKSGQLKISSQKHLLSQNKKKNNTDASIEIINEGGIVHQINVLCSCGNKIEILCNYADSGSLNNLTIAPQGAAQNTKK